MAQNSHNDCFTEHDWKLFRSRIADWQERYMEKLIHEYVKLLCSDEIASGKFWALEKRIRNDKRDAGVIVEMRRSGLVDNLIALYLEGAISDEDLDGFSENLVNTIKQVQ